MIFRTLSHNLIARWSPSSGTLTIVDKRTFDKEIQLSPEAQIELVRLLEDIVEGEIWQNKKT